MKTLKLIITFCILNSAFLISSDAQIAYTNVNPDNTICSNSSCLSSFNLDLNNDGISDYSISCGHNNLACGGSYASRSFISVFGISGNSTVAVTNTTYPLAMNFNDSILSGLTFSAFGYLREVRVGFASGCSYTHGVWPDAIEHYLGLKLIVGVNTYYGWARMIVSVSSSYASCTIKDYAYNTVANQPILAGQTCPPQAKIKANGPVSFCSGSSVILSSKNSSNTLKYQWKKNNINITGATNKNYTATTAGDYKVKVTDSINNCYKISGIITVIVPCKTSNKNIVEALQHLSVYPNPATNSVTIKFPSDEAGEISIVNLFRQIVFSEKINSEQKTIDVSKFSGGMYVVRWNSGEKFETKTFSIIK